MKIASAAALCLFVLLFFSACATAPVSITPTPLPATPTLSPGQVQIAPTATPIILTRTEAEQSKRPPAGACTLITTKDLGGLFAAEVMQPIYASNQSNQVIFPAENVSTNESYCVYMAFHLSGSQSGTYYQVTYWLDTPNGAAPDQWARVWEEGKAHAEQTITGVADDAFYGTERLTFKKANTYVTVEVISTRMDTKTQEGISQQIDIEKQVALAAVGRMQ